MNINNYLKQLLIKLYLYYYLVKQFIYQFIIRTFGPIKIIYYITENRTKNITLNYYSGLLEGFQTGNYIIKCYDSHHVKYHGFTGQLKQLSGVKLDEELYDRNKKITLLKNDTPINIDMTIIDNYVNNIKKNQLYHNIPTKSIFDAIGINCTHVKIISMRPIQQIHKHIDEIDIMEMYD